MQALETVRDLFQQGEFSQACEVLRQVLSDSNTPVNLTQALQHLEDQIHRVRRDFNKSESDVLSFIREVRPETALKDLESWIQNGKLEVLTIDGERCYFNQAARNLFRLDPEMKKLWDAHNPQSQMTSGSGARIELDAHLQDIIAASINSPSGLEPRRFRIRHSVSVNTDAVPAGEQLRCWLPYPRSIPKRQDNVRLIASHPMDYTLAPESTLQRTIYFEQPATAGEETLFWVEYELNTYGSFHDFTANDVTPTPDLPELLPYLIEEAPHIVFTPKLRALSTQILGTETHPYGVAQLIFKWMNANIPWASAREYSTLDCIPEYAEARRHGDCGIQTLLFITLCRMNGIPARWQSGWEFQPPDDSMHDWGEIYFHPIGWVPFDITYGLRQSDDSRLRWFYLHGMDSYRIIFNDQHQKSFTPPKRHARSDDVDNQRGEVETAKRNLFYDEWTWTFDWHELDAKTP